MKTVQVNIDPKFLLYTVLLLIVLLIGWESRAVLIILFIAFILNAGLRPLVDALEKRKIARPVSIGIIYLTVLVLIVLISIISANQFIIQVTNLADALPGIVKRTLEAIPGLGSVLPLQVLNQEIGAFAQSILKSGVVSGQNVLEALSQAAGAFGSVGGLLLEIFTVIMVSVFMLLRRENIYDGIIQLMPENNGNRARKLMERIETSLGNWMIGQIALMLIIGILIYLILLIPSFFDPTYTLHQYALPIAIAAGLLEALPNIGPTVTLVIAVLIALGTSGPFTVLYVVIAFTAAQTAEANLIVPMLMKRAVDVDPILTMLGILAFFQIAGPIGALLAVPVIAIVQITIEELAKEHRLHKTKEAD